MKVVYADEFRKAFDKLPEKIHSTYRLQEEIFETSSHDPRLHLKKLKGHSSIFSFRITRAYRALFAFVERDTALMITIGHRKDVYR